MTLIFLKISSIIIYLAVVCRVASATVEGALLPVQALLPQGARESLNYKKMKDVKVCREVQKL